MRVRGVRVSVVVGSLSETPLVFVAITRLLRCGAQREPKIPKMGAEMHFVAYASRTTAFLLLIFALAACGDDDDNDIGDPYDNFGEGPGIAECVWDDVEVPWDEETPEGEVPGELIADNEGNYEEVGSANYHGDDVTFQIGLERRGDHAIFRQEDPDKSAGCGDRLDLPVTLTIANDSGTLDESFDVYASASSQDNARVTHNFDASDLQGSWDPEPPEGQVLLGLALTVDFTLVGTSGEVSMRLEETHDGAVSQQNERVYFW